eukprot:1803757-Pleurochrysis_carterae.AAC.4
MFIQPRADGPGLPAQPARPFASSLAHCLVLIFPSLYACFISLPCKNFVLPPTCFAPPPAAFSRSTLLTVQMEEL